MKITPATITITASAKDKVYDGSANAELVNVSVTGIAEADTSTAVDVTGGTFADANVGNDKTVSIVYTVTGANASNYTVDARTTTANITAAEIDWITFTGDEVTYNASNHSITVDGKKDGDTVYYSADNGATWSTVVPEYKDAGTYTVKAKVVRTNYEDWTGEATLTIKPKQLTISGTTVESRIYDGTDTARITAGTLAGVCQGDEVGVTASGAFGTANVNSDGVLVRYALTGTGASNYVEPDAETIAASIRKAPLTLTFTAQNKTYNGNAAATINDDVEFSGLVNGEEITVSGASGTFVNNDGVADKNAGDQKKVVVSGYSFSGADINNYDLTVADVKANIGKKDLTVRFTGVYGKYYDGTADLPADHIASDGFDGLVSGDELYITINGGTFDDPNVGTNKPVTVNYTLTGADRNNYRDYQEDVKTDIYAVDIPVVFVSKTELYDGTAHTIAVTGGTEAGDEILYSTDGVNYSTVLPTFTKAGTYRVWAKVTRNANYNVWNNYADLTVERRPLTVTFSDPSKEYDGSVEATITGYTFDNLVSGDDVIITIRSAEFYRDGRPDKNVETHKFVDVEPSFGGADADNYTISYAPLYGNITPKGLTLEFTANNKPYDGGVTSDARFNDFTGLVSGDVVTVENVVGTFADPNVGENIKINLTYDLGGADLGNYNVSAADLYRNITPAINTDITFIGDTLTYDGAAHKIEVSGTKTGDTVLYSLDGKNYSDTVPTFTEAGTHPVYAKVIRANYLDWINGAILVINKKELTVSFTADNKVYDGSDAATILSQTVTGVVSGDDVTVTVDSAGFVDANDLPDPNVGNDKTVKVYYEVTGTKVNNYEFVTTGTATADIMPRTLNVYFAANDTIYNGSADADVTFSHFGTNDLVVGDNFNVAILSATYVGPDGVTPVSDVGTHSIKVVCNVTPEGQTSAANYTIVQHPVSAAINNANFNFSFTGDNVTFDGNNHSFTIGGVDTATDTIMYSTDGVNFNLTQMPEYRNAGSYQVFAKVSRTGHGDEIRSATLNIAPLQLTVSGSTVVSHNYNGSRVAVVNVGTVATIYDSGVTVTATGLFPSADPGVYDNAEDGYVAVTYGVQGDTYGNYLAPVGENLPGEIIAPETPSMVVTTDSDAVDPWDNLISLREALTVYYKTDGTISYNNGNITYGKGSNTTVRFDSELTEIKPEYSYTLTGEHDGLVIEGAGRIIFNGQTCLDTENQNFTIFNVTESASMTFNGLTFKNISTDQGAAVATATGLTLIEGDVLTLNGCEFTSNTGTANGGALSVYNLDVAVSDSTFTGNSAAYGGAVYVNGGSLTVDGTSVFTGNTATAGNGGAVYASSAAAGESVNINGARFETNHSASNGGAVYLNTAGDSVITDSVFTGNTATESTSDGKTGNGGAIDSDGGNLTIDGGSFSGNTATENGGAVYVSQDLLTVENVTFTSNSSEEDGGAVYGDDDAVLYLTEAVFTQNSASSDGGAVRGVGVVNESEFTSNTAADGEGGAIYSEGSKKDASSGSSVPAPADDDTPVVKSLQVENSSFTQNSAKNGGAINTDSVNLEVINSNFQENSTSESGGAIQLHKGSAAVRHSFFTENAAKNTADYDSHGGAIYNSKSSLTVVDTLFERNESYYGGAISGQVNAESSVFTANKALIASYADPEDPNETLTTGDGGAVYGNGAFSDCTFTGNTANNGGAVFGLDSTLLIDIDDCTFTSNSAAVSGGAVFCDNLTASRTTFDRNSAGTESQFGFGGAVYASSLEADLALDYCWVVRNSANQGGAIFSNGAALDIYESVVAENTVSSLGGQSAYGGGIFTGMNQATTIRWSTVANNTVTGTGEGADLYGNSAVTASYSILLDPYQANGTLSLVNSLYRTDGHGGSAAVDPDQDCDVWNGTDPLFAGGTDYMTAYTLRPDSVAVDGTLLTSGGPAEGITGRPRPYHMYYDYGAIEWSEKGPETPSMIVTTGEDVINPYDNLISLREALTVYFQTDGTYTIVGDTIIYGKDYDNVTVTFKNDLTVINANSSFRLTSAQNGVKINGTNSPDQANHIEFTGNGFSVFDIGNGVNYAEFNNLIFNDNTAVYGAAIYSHNYDPACEYKVQNCKFSGNTAQEGGAVFVPDGTLTVSGSAFTENKATVAGGAIRALNADTNISDSEFTGNESVNASAVYSNGGTLTVSGSAFTGNKATQNGAAVWTMGSDTNVSNSEFSGNTALNGSAVYSDGGSLTVSGSVFTGNSAAGDGAAIWTRGSDTNVSNSEFSGNTAEDGSAVFANGGTLTVDNSAFTGNITTGTAGGTILVESSTASINYSRITGNEAFLASAIHANGGTFTVYQSLVADNTSASAEGAGIYLVANATGHIRWSTVAGNTNGRGTTSVGNCDLFTEDAGSGSDVYGSIVLYGKTLHEMNIRYESTLYADASNVDVSRPHNYELQSGDVLFAGGSDIETKYTLDANSVAINGTGVTGTADNPAVDLAGTARPQGSAYDCGAYEYAAAAPAAPAALPYRDAADAAFESLDDDPGFDLF